MNSLRHGISEIKMENMGLKENMENMKYVHADECYGANYCELTPTNYFIWRKKKVN